MGLVSKCFELMTFYRLKMVFICYGMQMRKACPNLKIQQNFHPYLRGWLQILLFPKSKKMKTVSVREWQESTEFSFFSLSHLPSSSFPSVAHNSNTTVLELSNSQAVSKVSSNSQPSPTVFRNSESIHCSNSESTTTVFNNSESAPSVSSISESISQVSSDSHSVPIVSSHSEPYSKVSVSSKSPCSHTRSNLEQTELFNEASDSIITNTDEEELSKLATEKHSILSLMIFVEVSICMRFLQIYFLYQKEHDHFDNP